MERNQGPDVGLSLPGWNEERPGIFTRDAYGFALCVAQQSGVWAYEILGSSGNDDEGRIILSGTCSNTRSARSAELACELAAIRLRDAGKIETLPKSSAPNAPVPPAPRTARAVAHGFLQATVELRQGRENESLGAEVCELLEGAARMAQELIGGTRVQKDTRAADLARTFLFYLEQEAPGLVPKVATLPPETRGAYVRAMRRALVELQADEPHDPIARPRHGSVFDVGAVAVEELRIGDAVVYERGEHGGPSKLRKARAGETPHAHVTEPGPVRVSAWLDVGPVATTAAGPLERASLASDLCPACGERAEECACDSGAATDASRREPGP